MFPGGIRALLLQSLHPLAMAGVAGHSGFKGDPWGRLQRTSEFLATTTFGTVEHATKQIQRVRRIHERVRGTAPDGRPYAASDPHLLRWVHITEADSFLTAYQRYAALATGAVALLPRWPGGHCDCPGSPSPSSSWACRLAARRPRRCGGP
jgi:uncharacterized protein (DUF2236 family)